MPGTPYPKEQMHRIAYTKLSERQIADKLSKVAASGPTSVSPLSDVFAGKSIRIVTDKGPALAYTFGRNNRLSVAENGGGAVEAGYGALALNSVAFFSHLIPGTQRGYAVAIDQDKNLATVFELWFSGYEDNREVQREIYYGYVEQAGQEAPKARHVTTNRVEGKGFYWKQDTGAETLEFYPSAAYSNFVELSRLGGELGFCAPSDYIKINDDLYIYTRTECEFSGTFTAYVMDLNRVEQVGVRLGFDANDALEYYVFRGKGEWLGQLAQFEKFGDEKRRAGSGGRGRADSGERRAARLPAAEDHGENDEGRSRRRLSPRETSAFPAAPAGVVPNGPGARWAPIADRAPTGWPANRSRFATTPRRRWNTASTTPTTLNWRKEGDSGWTKARYQAWESAPGVILFGHLLEGAPNHDGHSIVADFHQGLVTCFNGYLNTPYFANEAGVKIVFGVIEMEGLIPPKYNRHQFTDEMVGRAVSQNYAPGLTSMHLYSTPHSLSWIIFTDADAGGLEWSGPAAYVKIRDGLYFMYWLEEACNGTLGTILVNLHTMRDVGVGYNCGDKRA